MTPRARAAISDALIKRARSKEMKLEVYQIERIIRPLAKKYGLHFHNGQLNAPTKYFNIFDQVYPGKTLPTIVGFTDFLHEHFDTGAEITFDVFLDYAKDKTPPDEVQIYPSQFSFRAHYGHIYAERELPKTCSYRDLFQLAWQSEAPNIGIANRSLCFTYKKDKLGRKIVDKDGNPVLMFTRFQKSF